MAVPDGDPHRQNGCQAILICLFAVSDASYRRWVEISKLTCRSSCLVVEDGIW